eukprot:2025699-Pleurochrysis_carterae.AAC.1
MGDGTVEEAAGRFLRVRSCALCLCTRRCARGRASSSASFASGMKSPRTWCAAAAHHTPSSACLLSPTS